jgi:hypothetical protein
MKKLMKISIKGLNNIKIVNIHVYKVGGVKNKLIYETNKIPNTSYFEQLDNYAINGEYGVLLTGSSLVQFRTQGFASEKEYFRVSFHSAFIGSNNRLEVGNHNIGPEDLAYSTKLSESFKVIFEFEDVC